MALFQKSGSCTGINFLSAARKTGSGGSLTQNPVYTGITAIECSPATAFYFGRFDRSGLDFGQFPAQPRSGRYSRKEFSLDSRDSTIFHRSHEPDAISGFFFGRSGLELANRPSVSRHFLLPDRQKSLSRQYDWEFPFASNYFAPAISP